MKVRVLNEQVSRCAEGTAGRARANEVCVVVYRAVRYGFGCGDGGACASMMMCRQPRCGRSCRIALVFQLDVGMTGRVPSGSEKPQRLAPSLSSISSVEAQS
jgi:hypothetical protein